MKSPPRLTMWGWIALLLILWMFAKVPLGNQIIKYGIILLILLLLLMNAKQFAVQ